MNAVYTNKSYSTFFLEAPFCKTKQVSLILILVSVAVVIVIINLQSLLVFQYEESFHHHLWCFTHPCPNKGNILRGNLQKKPSIFKDIIQIEVDLQPSHPIFDKFIFDKVLLMLSSLPPLEILTKIVKNSGTYTKGSRKNLI